MNMNTNTNMNTNMNMNMNMNSAALTRASYPDKGSFILATHACGSLLIGGLMCSSMMDRHSTVKIRCETNLQSGGICDFVNSTGGSIASGYARIPPKKNIL